MGRYRGAGLLLLLGACDMAQAPSPWSELLEDLRQPENWATHGGSFEEQRFSVLDQIDSKNVSRLGLAWAHELDTFRGQEGTPLVVDGVMYATTAWSKVVALDAATGEQLWIFDPEVPGEAAAKGCCDVVNRGAAYYDGKIFVATLDGRLIALEAASGTKLWSTVTVDQSQNYTSTGAPRVVKGKVVIGNGGADFGVRGYVSAYNADDGSLAWRFYTVPTDPADGPDNAASDSVMELAAQTWSGEFWAAGGGGTVWDSIVYDEKLDQVLIGVGNGTPWNHQIRSQGKGDNLFLSSIVALDPDTGAYRWHYQSTPAETWDFTATQQITLADFIIDGERLPVLLQAPKNGFFYVIDRRDGTLISAEKYVPANWAERIDLETGRPVEDPAARFVDAPFLMTVGGAGGHNWQPMSYSPKTGLVYIPAQELPMLYQADPNYRYSAIGNNTGIDQNFSEIPTSPEARQEIAASLKGRLLAWDPVRQREAWHVEYGDPWNGGVLTTAGNLVFQGNRRGAFTAYDALTGKRLWTFDARAGILGGPVSYSVGGEQYIAVMVGYGGAVGLALPEFGDVKPPPPGRILAFKLGGTGSLPQNTQHRPPPNPPNQKWPAVIVAEGATLYTNMCSRCHALGAYSAGVVPDLRRSGALTDERIWREIVLDGILSQNGMPGFSRTLRPQGAEAIRAYIGEKARELKTEQR